MGGKGSHLAKRTSSGGVAGSIGNGNAIGNAGNGGDWAPRLNNGAAASPATVGLQGLNNVSEKYRNTCTHSILNGRSGSEAGVAVNGSNADMQDGVSWREVEEEGDMMTGNGPSNVANWIKDCASPNPTHSSARTLSETGLNYKSNTDSGRCSRTVSEVSLDSVCSEDDESEASCHDYPMFGYRIPDLDHFLTTASMSSPGNIPMAVLAPCQLYVTQQGRPQTEVSLPPGMVVNCLFKKLSWLYVQTPRGDQGYVKSVSLAALGVLPVKPCCMAAQRRKTVPRVPSWSTVSLPRPLSRDSDAPRRPTGLAEIGLSGIISGRQVRTAHHHPPYMNIPRMNRAAMSDCEGTDRLKRRAISARSLCGDYTLERTRGSTVTRQTLLVVSRDFSATAPSTLSVQQGQVVSLVHADVDHWFCVRTKDGRQGFIPAQVAGNGFL